MSQVKRFLAGDIFEGAEVVYAEEFDRVTAERDAALAELDMVRKAVPNSTLEPVSLQQLLNAKDERSDLLEGLLRTSIIAMKRIYQAGYNRIIAAGGTCDTPAAMMEGDPAAREIRAALKPAEGGGDEYRKSCEAAHKALSMENQRITPARTETREDAIERLFGRFGDG